MKKKDIIYIVVAVAVLAIAGLFLYSKSSAGKSAASKTTTVEVVDPISSTFDAKAVAQLQDPTVAQNFAVKIDLSGLGNTSPFGPLP